MIGLLRTIAIFAIFWFGYKLIKGWFVKTLGNVFRPPASASRQVAADMVQDPQCKSYVSMDHAVAAEFNGERFYFCSDECAKNYGEKKNG